jgi:hypothetical protein
LRCLGLLMGVVRLGLREVAASWSRWAGKALPGRRAGRRAEGSRLTRNTMWWCFDVTSLIMRS